MNVHSRQWPQVHLVITIIITIITQLLFSNLMAEGKKELTPLSGLLGPGWFWPDLPEVSDQFLGL